MKLKKITPVWIALILIILFAAAVLAVSLPRFGVTVYGDRLNGVEELLPSEEVVSNINKELTSDVHVKSVKYNHSTRIVSFIVDMTNDANKDDAKYMADKIASFLSEDTLAKLDVQVVFTCQENPDNTTFTLYAYRHHGGEGFVFSVNNPVESSETE